MKKLLLIQERQEGGATYFFVNNNGQLGVNAYNQGTFGSGTLNQVQ